MSRYKSLFLSAIFLAMCCAGAASAQTVANVSIVSGSGQLVCDGCPNLAGYWQYFEPLVVKVTDAAGNPIANAPVDWSSSFGAVLLYNNGTLTDANGLAQNRLLPGVQLPGAAYQQATVTATSGGKSVTFVETQSTFDKYVITALISPDTGSSFTGVAGSQSPTQIKVHVANQFAAIPNVSVRLVNFDGASPAGSCVTSPNADPGSALTDANGDAICTLVFGPQVGDNQTAYLLVGGVNKTTGVNPLAPAGSPYGYSNPGSFLITVTPAIPGKILTVSGDNQTANQGAALGASLVARVTDAAGTANIAGQSVTWTVTPSNAATLGNATTVSGADGTVTNSVTFTNLAAGPVSIKAALTSNSSISTTFTANATVVIVLSSFEKVSGDAQSAPANANFTDPLVVKALGSNGQPMANVPVVFTVTSGQAAFVGASTTVTNANGLASVQVRAGLTQGQVTIAATAVGTTRNFTLTVTPEAPPITKSSFTNGAQAYTSYDNNHSALSPCGIALLGTGAAPSTPGLSAVRLGPLAQNLSGISIAFGDKQAPIYSVSTVNGAQQIAFQVPCDVTLGESVPVRVTVNGAVANTNVVVRAAGPGIFESAANQSDNTTRAILLKPDGTFVSDTNKARAGDVVRMFATGLGSTVPAVSGTGALPPMGIDALVRGTVIVGVNNQGTRLVQARLSRDLVGVYEVDFEVPSGVSGSNIVFSLAVNAPDGTPTQFSAGSKIPIQ